MKVGEPNLEIQIKWIHCKSFSGHTKIFGKNFIGFLTVRSELSPINLKKPHNTGDGVIPPLNPPRSGLGLRLKIPSLKNMRGSGRM